MSTLFNLRSANRIANLTCDRVDACYHDITSSPEIFADFLASLEYIAKRICIHDRKVRHEIRLLKSRLETHGMPKLNVPHSEDEMDALDFPAHDPDIIEILQQLALILSAFPVKAILLPEVRYTGYDSKFDFISSPETLDTLAKLNESCGTLILQPHEQPTANRVTIFDAFPYFGIALRQLDRWPAVLFWTDERQDSVFVPIADEDQLIEVFKLADGAENAFELLHAYAEVTLHPSHYYLHLSDIHFTSRNPQRQLDHMEHLVDAQLKTLHPRDSIDFVVTGDSVNTPNEKTVQMVHEFGEYLETINHNEILFVPGNHDLDRFGLSLRSKNKHWASIASGYPRIKIVEDIKVIFMLFNSNAGGMMAQGEVGRAQMDAMRELLLKVKNLDTYTPIAVVHHHVAAASYYNEMYGSEQWRREVGRYKGKERFKRLRDADEFLEFLRQYQTRFILHGHKHSPLVLDADGIIVIACGSSTGRNKDYVSYNMLKFSEGILTCTQFVEQMPERKIKKIDAMALAIEY